MNISSSLSMLQSAMSSSILNRAMGRDAQTMVMLDDMAAGIPQPPAQILATSLRGMDIRV